MRINQLVAASSELSRRAADAAIIAGRVFVNDVRAQPGQEVAPTDSVTLDGRSLTPAHKQLIMLNKPAGYVTSRNGQGAKTIYDLLPSELRQLKPVGRLDKDSSGLLLVTNDGELAHQLTHPSFQKTKCYKIELGQPLAPQHREQITRQGVMLDDGPSQFELRWLDRNDRRTWLVTMYEGRNRQIRRTFAALGYQIRHLSRVQFGEYSLGDLASGEYKTITAAGVGDSIR